MEAFFSNTTNVVFLIIEVLTVCIGVYAVFALTKRYTASKYSIRPWSPVAMTAGVILVLSIVASVTILAVSIWFELTSLAVFFYGTLVSAMLSSVVAAAVTIQRNTSFHQKISQ